MKGGITMKNSMEKNPLIDKLSITERLSFALGEIPGAANSIVAAFIMLYYTESVGMSGVAVGMMLFVSKIFDGISDLLAGSLIDKTKTKWGKARPWLLWLSVPTGISLALIFMVPQSFSDTGKLIYAFLTYNLFMTVFYTISGCAKASLMALMTQNPKERGILAQFALLAGLGGGILGTSITIPFVTKLGQGALTSRAWTMAFIIYGVIVTCAMLVSFALSREYVTPAETDQNKGKKDQNITFFEGFSLFFKNKYLLISAFSSLMVGFATQFNSTAQTFFYQENMGDLNLTASMNLLNLIPTILSVIFLPGICLKLFGKKKSICIGASTQIVGLILRTIAYQIGGVPMLAVGTILYAIGAGPLSCVVNTLPADAVDYGEKKSGKRIEGMGFSIMTFAGKVTAGCGAAIVGIIIGDGINISKFGVACAYGYLPALFLALDIIVISLFYKYEADCEKLDNNKGGF